MGARILAGVVARNVLPVLVEGDVLLVLLFHGVHVLELPERPSRAVRGVSQVDVLGERVVVVEKAAVVDLEEQVVRVGSAVEAGVGVEGVGGSWSRRESGSR